MASSSHDILGHKLFDGKTKTIYSMIDQPGLICIYRKDFYQSSGSTLNIPGSRRSSVDNGLRFIPPHRHLNNEIPGTGALTTSITTCVFEILRDAAIPTFYVAPHPQPDMFIARKCTMIPILWIIRRQANDTYAKRYPGIVNGHHFIPPLVEIYYKRNPLVYRRLTMPHLDDYLEPDPENVLDNDDDSDSDECLSSIWSYEQLLNAHFDIENLKITQTEIEYMYETVCTVFDILEHVWMVKKGCQLIDLKIEFGITTTTTKEIVVANFIDVETWHLRRPPMSKSLLTGNDLLYENLVWINSALRELLDLNVNMPPITKIIPRRGSFMQLKQLSSSEDLEEEGQQTNLASSDSSPIDVNGDGVLLHTSMTSLSPSTTSRCIIICSTSRDVEFGQKMKMTLNDTYNIQCDIRFCSTYKSTQTILKILAHYAHEHSRPTVIVTFGNINNGLAMCLAANSQYPVIHCSLINSEQHNTLVDANSFISNEPLSSSFSLVFTMSSAIQNVIQILAMSDWKLWTKQRGKRLKHYIDLLITDQQLTATPMSKANSGILTK